MSERIVSPEEVEVTKRYAGAFTKSAAVKDHFADLAMDERMMTLLFAIIRDKIAYGREVDEVPDDQPTPQHFYPMVMENLMSIIPLATLSFQMMDRMTPAAFNILLEGKEPTKEALRGED